MSRILAAIPAFNEEKTIGSIVLGTKAYVDEVAVVDDGSTDSTAWLAERAGATVLRHETNLGYGAALKTCFKYARSNGTQVLVVLDGDGQHRPEMIPKVIEPVAKGGVDICIGSRFLQENTKRKVPLYRRFGIRALTKLTNLGTRGRMDVRDAQSGFRAYSRKAVDLLDPLEADMGASAEILWDAGKHNLHVREVPMVVDYDVDGSSQGPVRHALGVIGSMVRYVETEHALLSFGVPGLAMIGLGVVFGVGVVTRFYSTAPHDLALGQALITVLLVTLGMMLSFTGLILHAVINANRRTR